MKTLVATLTLALGLSLNRAAVAKPSSVLHFAGRFASAEIESLDASGCIDTRVDLFGEIGKSTYVSPASGSQQSSTNFAFVFIHRQDYCADVALLDAIWYGPIPESDLTIARSLDSAHLHTTQVFYDEVSTHALTVSLDVTWTATAKTLRGSGNIHDGSVIIHFSGDDRPAVTGGVITDGTTNFAPPIPQ
jgi:hypothetical protein